MATDKELLGAELAADLAQKKSVEDAEKKAAKEREKAEAVKKKKIKIVLKNTLGDEVPQSDYFFSTTGEEDTAPSYFPEVCGNPVDREELITVFNKVFKPKDGILFYKAKDKEVYLIIVPLKHSSTVGASHNSVDGEFQKHAISFIAEGSVNLDSLRNKLIRVASTIKIAE